MRKPRNNERGQALLELIVVLLVLGLMITAVVSVVTNSVRNARFAKDQAQASRFAQEGLEWIRAQRDTGWTNFQSKTDRTYCMQTLSWALQSNCTSTQTISGTGFVRNSTLATVDSNTVSVDVKVSWNDSMGSHQARQSTYLTNWR
ncbi:MAG: prepilin-type N-terminal cleavage/methylation domain-containing protein [Candidatus Blackburnbacteria bacterium]|nr:prepilin-type N-terminal cleavage/methylation domain-containing protein [Candidatus Blackburnbacteria bacterium]